MDRIRLFMTCAVTAGLVGCGGGGGTTTPTSVEIDTPTTVETDVATLTATVSSEGLNVSTAQNIAGGNVSLAIDSEFGITIQTGDGVTLVFDERNRTYYTIFGGYSSLDETDLTVIALPGNDPSSLTYATYGFWAESDDPGLIDGDTAPVQGGAFFGGNNTPIGNMPSTGTANYSGFVIGNDSSSDGGDFGGGLGLVVGDATLAANFATNRISGLLELNNAEFVPYTDITLSETSISANTFEGTATTGLGHSGTFRGQFFGPAAQELAGLASLSEGPSNLQVSFGGAQ